MGTWCCATGAEPSVSLTGVDAGGSDDSGRLEVRVRAPANAPAPICATFTLHLDGGP